MSLNLVVVEDDEQDYELLFRVLKKCDFPFELTWLKDGDAAIKYLEKTESLDLQDPRNNVYILDINLPKVSGLELVKKIKGHPTTKESVVIILSGSESKQDVDIAKENGADFYLVKPFGRQAVIEFRKTINSIFRDLAYEK